MRFRPRTLRAFALLVSIIAVSACSTEASTADAPASGACTDPFSCQQAASSGASCPFASGGGLDAVPTQSMPSDERVATVAFTDAPAEVTRNLAALNSYRQAAGLKPLLLDKNLSLFAATGSTQLARDKAAHAHFANASTAEEAQAGFCGGSGGENQAPGWPAEDLGSTVDAAIKAMMDEGPGGGHHDNILNPAWGKVGIGLVVVDGQLYLTNDFSPACD